MEAGYPILDPGISFDPIPEFLPTKFSIHIGISAFEKLFEKLWDRTRLKGALLRREEGKLGVELGPLFVLEEGRLEGPQCGDSLSPCCVALLVEDNVKLNP